MEKRLSEYFAKVLNAPNWIGINVLVNGETLDLNTCKNVRDFRRELNMQEGWYTRSFMATLPNDTTIEVLITRFLSLDYDEVGAIKYQIRAINQDSSMAFHPYLDSGITNEDTNWDDQFWNTTGVTTEGSQAFIEAHTMKTNFATCTFMESRLYHNNEMVTEKPLEALSDTTAVHHFKKDIKKGDTLTLVKFGGYTVSTNHKPNELISAAKEALQKVTEIGFEALLEQQKKSWAKIWEMSDITIEGDVKAQQGIRFNIFHLNQTYLGKDSRLNIGPKGFTGRNTAEAPTGIPRPIVFPFIWPPKIKRWQETY